MSSEVTDLVPSEVKTLSNWTFMHSNWPWLTAGYISTKDWLDRFPVRWRKFTNTAEFSALKSLRDRPLYKTKAFKKTVTIIDFFVYLSAVLSAAHSVWGWMISKNESEWMKTDLVQNKAFCYISLEGIKKYEDFQSEYPVPPPVCRTRHSQMQVRNVTFWTCYNIT
jgi:hypothetical protein